MLKGWKPECEVSFAVEGGAELVFVVVGVFGGLWGFVWAIGENGAPYGFLCEGRGFTARVCGCWGVIWSGMEMQGGLAMTRGGGLGDSLPGDGCSAGVGWNLRKGGGLGQVAPCSAARWQGVGVRCGSSPLFLGPLGCPWPWDCPLASEASASEDRDQLPPSIKAEEHEIHTRDPPTTTNPVVEPPLTLSTTLLGWQTHAMASQVCARLDTPP